MGYVYNRLFCSFSFFEVLLDFLLVDTIMTIEDDSCSSTIYFELEIGGGKVSIKDSTLSGTGLSFSVSVSRRF